MDNPVERPLRAVDAWQQRHRPTAIVFAVVKKFGDDQAGNFVAMLTYYAFVSTFPLLLVFVTVTEIVLGNHPELRQRLLDSALAEFPVAGPTLQQAVRTPSGSGLALVLGLVAAFWGGSGLAGTMQTVLNSLWMVPKRHRPGFPWNYLRSIALLLLLGVGVVLTALTAAFAGAGQLLGLSGTGVHLVTILLTTARLLRDVPARVPAGDLAAGDDPRTGARRDAVRDRLAGAPDARGHPGRVVPVPEPRGQRRLRARAGPAGVVRAAGHRHRVRRRARRRPGPASVAPQPDPAAAHGRRRGVHARRGEAETRRPEQRVEVEFDQPADDRGPGSSEP